MICMCAHSRLFSSLSVAEIALVAVFDEGFRGFASPHGRSDPLPPNSRSACQTNIRSTVSQTVPGRDRPTAGGDAQNDQHVGVGAVGGFIPRVQGIVDVLRQRPC